MRATHKASSTVLAPSSLLKGMSKSVLLLLPRCIGGEVRSLDD